MSPAGHPAPYGGLRSELSDTELLARVRGGQDNAYEELYRRHAESVRRYARTCCRDAHTAEDLTGEVFARTLQAIRGGSGPETSVRAYLLTTVRRVAAAWGNTAKREQLVEDFAVFAVSAAGAGATEENADLGAEVRAMREAERSLAIRAFRTLPERWQTVLWHTAVEDESPSDIAPLLGLTPNATAVLAHRAREGLRQAYLQAHVSSTLTAGGDCARYADRLGAHARGALRTRADRELNRHLKECARCSAASTELADLNSALKGLLPVAYIGWFAAVYAAKAGIAVAGGAAAAGAAGGAAAVAGAASGTSAGAAGGGGAAEGLGFPAKAGIAAAVVAAVAAAGVAFALTGGDGKHRPAPAAARPPVTVPAVAPPATPAPAPKPGPRTREPVGAVPAPAVTPTTPIPGPGRTARPPESAPAPAPAPKSPVPTLGTGPAPSASPTATATPATPAPAPPTTPPPTTPPPTTTPDPVVYRVNALPVGRPGQGATGPTIRRGASGWWWDRWGLDIGGISYPYGITVHGRSTVTIDLNRACVSYDARAGVDDLARWPGTPLRFSVYGDGVRLWSSPVVRGGDPAVPVHADLSGVSTVRLVVRPEPEGPVLAGLADWADAEITCS
ncbi:sigma-70 family RNA polymerase sigma factor [Actinacidiphila sp. ITFR-21]|uniref:sigma-70 family RNA polymerase sigma factor n=1 Tax=Actinacidiphila sp. ITFR-21 TaxID=3075199 RepID=UPI00288AA95C|nr:sigma-70 family RNA polymerase sigma factor [Streptomyces sp. ITFR-21]WNI16968.1 sigma-70 family RNA polymerase sigma factor [Streptomyces sp. ITFR-21]